MLFELKVTPGWSLRFLARNPCSSEAAASASNIEEIQLMGSQFALSVKATHTTNFFVLKQLSR